MRQPLYKRLHQLEASARQLREPRRAEGDRDAGRKKMELFVRLFGTRGPNESLAEASARALEITSKELFQMLSAGIDPIHKYFTERGVFEELKTRKAAETIPASALLG